MQRTEQAPEQAVGPGVGYEAYGGNCKHASGSLEGKAGPRGANKVAGAMGRRRCEEQIETAPTQWEPNGGTMITITVLADRRREPLSISFPPRSPKVPFATGFQNPRRRLQSKAKGQVRVASLRLLVQYLGFGRLWEGVGYSSIIFVCGRVGCGLCGAPNLQVGPASSMIWELTGAPGPIRGVPSLRLL